MNRALFNPALTLALWLLWLLLQQSVSPGQILLGLAVALLGTWAAAPLGLPRLPLRRFGKIARLVGLVTADIVRSNIAVSAIILAGRRRPETAGFVLVPLELTDTTGLAVLACIVTATPGSAWLEHDPVAGTVLIHVLDVDTPQAWAERLKTRYERLLMEIFE